MNELSTIQQSPYPNTIDSIAHDLEQLGLESGMTIMVHTSLSSLGFVCGGPVAVIQALMKVITPEGTIVMPAFSSDYSDPALWQSVPVPSDWWDTIRAYMPVFDPAITPTRGIGKVPELFRTMPSVRRSYHPTCSFTAWGKQAEFVTANHSLNNGLGQESPLAKIYQLGGSVLLLGVGYDRNTSFHLAEYEKPNQLLITEGSPIKKGEKRVWRTFQNIEFEVELFHQIGSDFEKTGCVSMGKVGLASAKFFSQPQAVDFAMKWFRNDKTE
ncbi:aminoglycoside N(3)-acetyltransferase [Risungbinella massiliensis]|uniref:aminoglycoside N(3)-acetyltransferase n=1 Tax=Risungbinella massiliensis TaxID=1329796 RepID=UPI0005CC3019|nr:AAC(3) family N-acetyltransferase [Risungbinella massiliensis]